MTVVKAHYERSLRPPVLWLVITHRNGTETTSLVSESGRIIRPFSPTVPTKRPRSKKRTRR